VHTITLSDLAQIEIIDQGNRPAQLFVCLFACLQLKFFRM